ncbi:hypothetical protein BB561_001124 [Smittium simulii]|uniref:Altered inheritance of mitochondria protein 24, mitochondrial n=1 Tax=Smittium simulii TaxID=133385 RepID=A0A2T9YW39_9FUNG|nr:hypothetical protein BB561_001124 [Smittium simulii]
MIPRCYFYKNSAFIASLNKFNFTIPVSSLLNNPYKPFTSAYYSSPRASFSSAPNSSASIPEKDSNLLSGKNSSFISGFTSFVSGANTPPVSEPSFEKIDSSFGPLILSNLPAYSKYVIINGNLVGKSKTVLFKKKLSGLRITSLFDFLIGRKIINSHISTQEIAGDTIIAPLLPGDVAHIQMSGAIDYFVNKKNLLAHSPFLQISLSLDSNLPFSDGVFGFDRIAGIGSFLLSSESSLFKISLAENQEYFLDSDYVICYDNISAKNPTKSTKNNIAVWISTKSKSLANYTIFFIKSLTIRNGIFAYDLTKSLLYKINRLFKRGINVPSLVKVYGPGDIYISSKSKNTIANKIKRSISNKSE